MPQASARPTLGPVAAGPTETGPLMFSVTAAVTGPWATAQPPSRTAQDRARERFFSTDSSFRCDVPGTPSRTRCLQRSSGGRGRQSIVRPRLDPEGREALVSCPGKEVAMRRASTVARTSLLVVLLVVTVAGSAPGQAG